MTIWSLLHSRRRSLTIYSPICTVLLLMLLESRDSFLGGRMLEEEGAKYVGG